MRISDKSSFMKGRFGRELSSYVLPLQRKIVDLTDQEIVLYDIFDEYHELAVDRDPEYNHFSARIKKLATKRLALEDNIRDINSFFGTNYMNANRDLELHFKQPAESIDRIIKHLDA